MVVDSKKTYAKAGYVFGALVFCLALVGLYFLFKTFACGR